MIKIILTFAMTLATAFLGKNKLNETQVSIKDTQNIISDLDTNWQTEQTPIRVKDSLITLYGTESL